MGIYCTYLTIYRGNKLPPFYVGYTSLHKLQKGYTGTVSSKIYQHIWKNELKNHPELFTTKILSYHNTKDEALRKEFIILTSLKVHKNSLYINQNCGGINFCAPWEDREYRNKMLVTISTTHAAGKIWTDERRKQQSLRMQEISRNMSTETRRKATLSMNFDIEHYKNMSNIAANNPQTLKTRSKNMTSLNAIKKKCELCDFEANAGLLARHIKSKH